MGTRADFYIGRGQDAEWLGSVAWDGYEWAEDQACDLMKAKTADEFRAAVAAIEAERDDFTTPAEGWPWPWDDSNTTDYAYVFHDGAVTIPKERVDWLPNMAASKNVQWGNKSGLVVVADKRLTAFSAARRQACPLENRVGNTGGRMETLEEFNRRRRKQHEMTRWPTGPKHNGIACPKCGAELYDSDPMTTLTSNPPQKNVHCDCGYVGYRVA